MSCPLPYCRATRDSASLRRKLAEAGRHRCGYCLTTEANTGLPMTVDHIIPRAKGGETT
ncbi:MAG TPA: HNH endonuclease [Anaerolineae bacterium]|nr:HNH endonuclease [Anaerolineae bacterium]